MIPYRAVHYTQTIRSALHTRLSSQGRILRSHGRIVDLGSARFLSTSRVVGTAQIENDSEVSASSHSLHSPSPSPSTSSLGQSIAPQDLLEIYRGQVAQGRLTWDDEQVRTVMKLRHLYDELEGYSPPLDLVAKLTSYAPSAAKRASLQAKKAGWWDAKGKAAEVFGLDPAEKALVRVLSGEEEIANLPTPKGIMLTGPPGTGKSMVLSLFFDSLPTSHKRRWHYHAFTLWLYRQVFVEMERRRLEARPGAKVENMEKAAKKGWKSVFAGGRWEDDDGSWDAEVEAYDRVETIPFIVARRMILQYHILYFDEMQLVDASSAALLRDVLSWYWRLGGVIITCSNRVPDDLYHHGVQKERMAGFLDSLKARCEVVELDGGRDWRSGVDGERSGDRVKWFVGDQDGFEATWREAAAGHQVGPLDIGVYGRRLHVPHAAGGACRMTFEELCEQPLGAADYISLASTFDTFFIDAVPVLYLRNKNEARRLINLIDALYESRCQLFVSSVSPLESLFFPDAVQLPEEEQSEDGKSAPEFFDHSQSNESIMAAEALSETLHAAAHPNVSVYNPGERAAREKREAKESKTAGSFGVLGIWTGEDERFAYKRAVSRMREMTTSPSYAQEAWIPVTSDVRIWESSLSPAAQTPPPKSSPPPKSPKPDELEQGDFASEAGYSRPGLLQKPAEADQADDPAAAARHQLGSRVGAPVIQEKHMWGVVEGWGEKAGKWGKGAKAFKGK